MGKIERGLMKLTRAELIEKFKQGNKPQGSDYEALFNSIYLLDEGKYITGYTKEEIDAMISPLNAMMDEGYVFAGIAHPSDPKKEHKAKVFYYATEVGEYKGYLDSGGQYIKKANHGVSVLKNSMGVGGVISWELVDLMPIAQKLGYDKNITISQNAIRELTSVEEIGINGKYLNGVKESDNSEWAISSYIPIPSTIKSITFSFGTFDNLPNGTNIVVYDKNKILLNYWGTASGRERTVSIEKYTGDKFIRTSINLLDIPNCYVKFDDSKNNELVTTIIDLISKTNNNVNLINKEVEDSFYQIISSLSTDKDNILPESIFWEQGGMLDNGEPNPELSFRRLRTKIFIPINNLLLLSFKKTLDTNSDIYYYDANKRFIKYGAFRQNLDTALPYNAKYIKLTILNNNTNIVPEDIPEYGISIKLSNILQLDRYESYWKELKNSNLNLLYTDEDLEIGNYENGIKVRNANLLRSKSLISVDPYAKYFVKNINALWSKDGGFYLNIYDKDKNWIADYKYPVNSDSFILADIDPKFNGARYITFAAGLIPDKTNNTIYISENILRTFSIYMYKDLNFYYTKNNVDIFPHSIDMFEQGSMEYDGTPSQGTPSPARVRTKFIEVNNIKWLHFDDKESNYKFNLYLYDKDFNLISGYFQWIDGWTNQEKFLGTSVKYVKFLIRNNANSRFTPTDIANADTHVLGNFEPKNPNLKKINIAQWNIGCLCGGAYGTIGAGGIEDSQIPTELPKLKQLITDLNADILLINEWSMYLDRSNTRYTYDEVFSQMYPYVDYINIDTAIISRYPLSLIHKKTTSNRTYLTGEVNVNGKIIGIACVHGNPGTFNLDESINLRTQEFTEFVASQSQYSISIIAGDLNTENNIQQGETPELVAQQLKVFEDAKYKLGNWGYWGKKKTYNDDRSMGLDNTMFKGGNFESFRVIEKNSVSDHYPSVSKISFYID